MVGGESMRPPAVNCQSWLPPSTANAQSLPREVVYILDTSGSMHGDSIIQAKAALRLALKRLRPEDRFNVIQFNNAAQALFPGAQPADSHHVQQALRYVDGAGQARIIVVGEIPFLRVVVIDELRLEPRDSVFYLRRKGVVSRIEVGK